MIVELTDPEAIFERGTPWSAGFDLASMETYKIPPQDHRLIKTGVRVALPRGTCGLLSHRSGFASKTGGMVIAGVIDSDYRGEILMNVYNKSDCAIWVTRGQRIAQMVIVEYETPVITFGTVTSDTIRGTGGFGSTDSRGSTTDIEEVDGEE